MEVGIQLGLVWISVGWLMTSQGLLSHLMRRIKELEGLPRWGKAKMNTVDGSSIS